MVASCVMKNIALSHFFKFGFVFVKFMQLLFTWTDKTGRILILHVTIDADQHVLINLYNAYTETEQVKVLQELQIPLKI